MAILSHEELWQVIEPQLQAEGYLLFDLDAPQTRGGLMRVFIKPSLEQVRTGESGAEGGVTIDDCVKVNRRLYTYFEAHPELIGDCTIEVSSPGVNRRLRRPEHFAGAVGERVRVDLAAPMELPKRGRMVQRRTLLGVLKEHSVAVLGAATLDIADEESGIAVQVPLSQVKEAHVDFRFE